jgi:hypothetical protein
MILLSRAEDRTTQGCDPSVVWDPELKGLFRLGVGQARAFGSRRSLSPGCLLSTALVQRR